MVLPCSANTPMSGNGAGMGIGIALLGSFARVDGEEDGRGGCVAVVRQWPTVRA
jgi:hypothetical protein